MMYLFKVGSGLMLAVLMILLNSGFSAQASVLDSHSIPPKMVLEESETLEAPKASDPFIRMNIMDRPMRDRAP